MLDPLIRKPFSLFLKGEIITLNFANVEMATSLWDVILSDRKKRPDIWPGFDDLNDLVDYLRDASKANPAQEVVYTISTEKHQNIGTVHLHSINHWDHKLEMGYWISKKFEGQGLMSKALTVVEHEIQRLGFHRIEIKCSQANIRSVNLARNNHFVLEGVGRDDCVEFGRYRSTCHFAKILG